ncbi:hypothetical protein [Rubellimicrobium roseum]|uniref:hypothetical protein n=1 Tax=Rubellimicrobium roseum TaxID=687525 RepID=UPI001FEC5EA7|nr:hypothetical protein [Rubellimicrobium roseum]
MDRTGNRRGVRSCWVHGLRSQDWTETRKAINDLARETRGIEALIGDRAGADNVSRTCKVDQ